MKHAMLTCMAIVLGAHNLKADIVYTLTSESINLGVTGTITTNGDTGTLGRSDILDWSITLPDGYVIDPSDGHLALGGNDLTATPTKLNFNFADTTTNSYLLFYSTSPIEQYELQDADNAIISGLGVPAPQGDIWVLYHNGSAHEVNTTPTGLAAQVPEPRSLTLLLTALAVVFVADRWRRCAARP